MFSSMKNLSSVQEIISYFGNQSAMARILSISPQAIQRWVSTNHLPIRRAIQIERLTDGKIRLEDMLPLTGVQKSEDVAS